MALCASSGCAETRRQLRVLIIEDHLISADLLLLVIRSAGFDPVHQVASTLGAVRRALFSRSWDLIVSADRFECCNVRRVLALTRQYCPSTPFLLVASHPSQYLTQTLLRAGAWACLDKQDLAELPALLQECFPTSPAGQNIGARPIFM